MSNWLVNLGCSGLKPEQLANLVCGGVTTATDKRVVAIAAPAAKADTDQLKCLIADLQRKLASATADETKWCVDNRSMSTACLMILILLLVMIWQRSLGSLITFPRSV